MIGGGGSSVAAAEAEAVAGSDRTKGAVDELATCQSVEAFLTVRFFQSCFTELVADWLLKVTCPLHSLHFVCANYCWTFVDDDIGLGH